MLVGSDLARTGFYVSESLFGANFLSNRDRFGAGTFDEKVTQLQIQALRYPGGSLTEDLFDIRNPNQTVVQDRNGVTHELVPLSDFLSYASGAGLPVTIVIPTRTALNSGSQGSRDVRPEVIEDLTAFARELLTGKYGSADIYSFEIGNEYWGSGQMTSVEYGRVSSAFALALRETVSSLKDHEIIDKDVKIAVQIGQNGLFDTSATSFHLNRAVMREFDVAEAAAVDAVVAHYYTDDEPVSFVRNDSRFNRLNAWESDPKFGDVDFFITEWNIQSPNSTEQGLKQAPALIAMFSELVFNGVKSAWVWPVQQNNRNSLAGNEGNLDLSIAGEMFKLLSTSLLGSYALGRTINERSGIYSFVKDDQLIIYVASHSSARTSHSLDLSKWSNSIVSMDGTLLTTDGNVSDHKARPIIQDVNLSLTGQNVNFFLDPYDVLQITIKIRDVDLLMPTGFRQGSDRSETIYGSNLKEEIIALSGDDRIYAFGGADTVSSGSGSDWVDLGAGNDVFRVVPGQSEQGNDTVFGGDGNDSIGLSGGNDLVYGGGGNDTLSGEGGNDVLNGNHGSDVLRGGSGQDQLYGGLGNDRLFGGQGNDLLDGGDGRDVLQGHAGNDTFFGGLGDDQILGGVGRDRLNGDAGNDTLNGGGGRDTLNGGVGNDVLSGGVNGDTFVFGRGFGNDRVLDFRKGDRLDFSDLNLSRAEVEATLRSSSYQNGGTLLDFGPSGTVFLEGLLPNAIGVGDLLW